MPHWLRDLKLIVFYQEYFMCRKPERTLNQCMFEKLVRSLWSLDGLLWFIEYCAIIRVWPRRSLALRTAKHQYTRRRIRCSRLFKSSESGCRGHLRPKRLDCCRQRIILHVQAITHPRGQTLISAGHQGCLLQLFRILRDNFARAQHAEDGRRLSCLLRSAVVHRRVSAPVFVPYQLVLRLKRIQYIYQSLQIPISISLMKTGLYCHTHIGRASDSASSKGCSDTRLQINLCF